MIDLEPLHKLVDMFGATGALAMAGWWYERKANLELQKRLMRLAAAQINAIQEVKSSLEHLKEIVRAKSRD